MKCKDDTNREGAQTSGSPLPDSSWGVLVTGAACQISSLRGCISWANCCGNCRGSVNSSAFLKRQTHPCIFVHAETVCSNDEIGILVTTLWDLKYELLSGTCLLTVDIFSCCNTLFKWLWSYLWMPECVWKSKWKYVKQICLPNVLSSFLQHPWKKWEVATMENLRLTTIQRQTWWQCSWELHEIFLKYPLLFSCLV